MRSCDSHQLQSCDIFPKGSDAVLIQNHESHVSLATKQTAWKKHTFAGIWYLFVDVSYYLVPWCFQFCSIFSFWNVLLDGSGVIRILIRHFDISWPSLSARECSWFYHEGVTKRLLNNHRPNCESCDCHHGWNGLLHIVNVASLVMPLSPGRMLSSLEHLASLGFGLKEMKKLHGYLKCLNELSRSWILKQLDDLCIVFC